MKNNAKAQRRKGAKDLEAEPTLDALVDESRIKVLELLQLGGDFPQCHEAVAESIDWLHAVQSGVTSLMEYCRFDESDPEVAKLMRKRIATIVAICQAWDARIIAEDAV